jgi:hypothetical protein
MVWENYQDRELLIARSIRNGVATDPKSPKGKASIPIVGKLTIKLEAHRVRLAFSPSKFFQRWRFARYAVSQSRNMDAHTNMNANRVLPEWRG